MWRTDKPPNETWVNVKRGDTTIEAKAIFGRDGMLPHWKLRDGSLMSPWVFPFWQEITDDTI